MDSMKTRAALVAALLIGGCALVDRRTFATDPPGPGTAERAALPEPEGRAALLTVRFATATPDYATAIGGAIRAAEARRPGLTYEVMLVTPSIDGPVLDVGASDTLAVARAIAAAGVPAARIALSGRIDRGLATREIRVFARRA